jgi:hypothetical protein
MLRSLPLNHLPTDIDGRRQPVKPFENTTASGWVLQNVRLIDRSLRLHDLEQRSAIIPAGSRAPELMAGTENVDRVLRSLAPVNSGVRVVGAAEPAGDW